jgi:site-specific DNA-methyltransferase (adenine-specific)
MNEPVVIGKATLYCGDCLDILPTLEGIDAVVSDPPYGIGYRYGSEKSENVSVDRRHRPITLRHNTKPIHGDDQPFDPAPWLNFKKVLLWGADHFRKRIPDHGVYLAWNKNPQLAPKDNFTDCEFAWCSEKIKRNAFIYQWKGLAIRKDGYEKTDMKGSVFPKRYHVSQKPVALMTWCIEHFKLPDGSLILDPYMGSGSTGIAAVNLGHRFIGIEIDPDYFAIACQRIEKAQRQQRMEFE